MHVGFSGFLQHVWNLTRLLKLYNLQKLCISISLTSILKSPRKKLSCFEGQQTKAFGIANKWFWILFLWGYGAIPFFEG